MTSTYYCGRIDEAERLVLAAIRNEANSIQSVEFLSASPFWVYPEPPNPQELDATLDIIRGDMGYIQMENANDPGIPKGMDPVVFV